MYIYTSQLSPGRTTSICSIVFWEAVSRVGQVDKGHVLVSAPRKDQPTAISRPIHAVVNNGPGGGGVRQRKRLVDWC